ncbi:bifunctional metallophosphatase/5'-nucleotidase [Alkalibacterium olivapovliticus]|uniref:LPXTG-motif cell wall-anchored protein n=1 Tax=Alkalibacterium olivapovliticus TaxID=99907 RepID=A0A2T0WCB7_9LACT|nr:bifunctional UDP-sugar hydrolase/5'-nucleotidase [Alkalibacterium olivapovliticus]PRY84174.1 LPXTG-motif cell wall-anchored protein [Alkalibacterium olivapovliticus]
MDNKGKAWILSFLSTALIFSAPMVTFAEEAAEEVEEPSDDFSLKVFHTNDIHASIDDFGRIAYFLNEQRAEVEHSLYLDAGDIFSGNPVVDLLDGIPMIELLNAVNLDLMTIGNHEFDYGQTVFQDRRNESNFNWISANTRVVDSSIPISQPDPFEIFEFEDVTVGVFGLTEAPPATSPSGIVGLEFDPYIETAQQYEELREEVDILIALNHIGISADRRLAEAIDFFDVIIGGHSHTTLNTLEYVNGTPIASTGSNARNIGILDMMLDSETGEVTVEGRLQAVEELSSDQVDPDVQSIVDGYNEDAEELLDEVLGVTTTGLTRDPRWERDVALGNMITDALRNFSGTDIAITNNGGIRAGIEPGNITARDIFTVDPFGNSITILEMTGNELKEVIDYSFSRSLDSYGPQIDLQTSGLNYIIYTDEDGFYVDSELFLNGEPMNMEETYSIATNNFIVSGGDGYDFSQGTITVEDNGVVTQALIQFVQETTTNSGAVDYEETEGRIQVLLSPEEETPEPTDPDDSEETPSEPVVPTDPEDPSDDDQPVEEEQPLEESEGSEEEAAEEEQPEADTEEIAVPEAEETAETEELEVIADADGSGETLPETATAVWTVGLIGLLSASTGTLIHFKKKRK